MQEKGLKTSDAAILGAISGANHVHTMAKAYGIPVILHTDHAAKNFFLGLMVYLMQERAFCKKKNRKTTVYISYARS